MIGIRTSAASLRPASSAAGRLRGGAQEDRADVWRGSLGMSDQEIRDIFDNRYLRRKRKKEAHDHYSGPAFLNSQTAFAM
jgi:hypothetical protein